MKNINDDIIEVSGLSDAAIKEYDLYRIVLDSRNVDKLPGSYNDAANIVLIFGLSVKVLIPLIKLFKNGKTNYLKIKFKRKPFEFEIEWKQLNDVEETVSKIEEERIFSSSDIYEVKRTVREIRTTKNRK